MFGPNACHMLVRSQTSRKQRLCQRRQPTGGYGHVCERLNHSDHLCTHEFTIEQTCDEIRQNTAEPKTYGFKIDACTYIMYVYYDV